MTDKLTLAELLAKLESHVPSIQEDFGGVQAALTEHEFYEVLESDDVFQNLGILGGEGEGDDYRGVIKYLPTGQFFGASGWYASYDGGYLEDVTEMESRPSVYYVNTK